MPKANIYYFTEDVKFNLPDSKSITEWIKTVIYQENYQLINLNFIFCSDSYLHVKNLEYLHHDTFTDVIAFGYAEACQTVDGEVYISIERIMDNARIYESNFWEELYRVMIHGVLHLLGYKDETLPQKEEMRKKELAYLAIVFKSAYLGKNS